MPSNAANIAKAAKGLIIKAIANEVCSGVICLKYKGMHHVP